MSHFSVMVILDGPDDLEAVMAPFDEGVEVPQYIAETREDLLKRRKDSIAKYKCILNFPNDNEIYNVEAVKKCLKECESITDELYGYRYIDDYELDENKNRISTYNPRSKWDWYQLGGRWQGLLTVKGDTKTARLGNTSWCNEPGAGVDLCKLADIDMEAMIQCSRLRLEEEWNDIQQLSQDSKNTSPWKYLNARYEVTSETTKEEYLNRTAAFETFAVLKDGNWYERGKMGWWGQVSDESSEDAWSTRFADLLSSTSKDKWIAIVDCHI